MKKSLGIIEVQGLTVALEIADAMVKTAQVTLVDLEKTNGFGWVTVKIAGDVSSVSAAIETGKRISQNKQKFVACKVISRPSESLEYMTISEEETKKESKEIKPILKEEVKRTRQKADSKKSTANSKKAVKIESVQLLEETSADVKEETQKTKKVSSSTKKTKQSSGVENT